MLRAVVACGWFGIQTWIGALALHALLGAAWPAWNGLSGGVAISFAIFWGIQVLVILRGTEGIKVLESWSAPLLLGGGALLLWWAISHGGGFGLPTTMTAFAFIGVAVTSATIVVFGEAIWDPVVLVSRIGGAGVIIFSALVVLAAQLTTNMAANVVSPSNDFSNLSPRRISYVTGGLITAVIGILMMPWKLYADAAAYIFTWLLGYSSLMGALGGILIADYWIIRKQRLSLPDLFKLEGRYTYDRGFNWRAIAALLIGIIPVTPGFLRAVTTPGGTVANPGVFDHLYSYAWFVTFILSFLVYLALMAGRGESDAASSRRV
jgi:NCS1 family nucleobase:cation symporter-1